MVFYMPLTVIVGIAELAPCRELVFSRRFLGEHSKRSAGAALGAGFMCIGGRCIGGRCIGHEMVHG